MKKLLVSLLSVVVLVSACGRDKTAAPGAVNNRASVAYDPEAVAYNEWDRAVRIDADMQNMFISTPRKIEKPIDMYMAMALALKYNYTRRLVNYEDSLIRAGKSQIGRAHV